MDERPQLVVVPTELERSDAFWDAAMLAGTVLVVWQLWLMHVPLPWMLPGVLVVALWTLTGEPAADVPFIGAIAAGLRSKLGLRRAHEWVMAFAHYTRLAVIPIWRANCAAFWKSCRRRITAWQVRLSVAMQWNRSHVRLSVYRIRSRSWGRPEA